MTFDYQTSPKVRVDLTAILDDKMKPVTDDFWRTMYRWVVTINDVSKEIFFGEASKIETKKFNNWDSYEDAWRISLEWYPEATVVHREWEKDWRKWSMLTANIVREESETKAKAVINKNASWYMKFSSDPSKRGWYNYVVTFQYDEERANSVFAWAKKVVKTDDELPF